MSWIPGHLLGLRQTSKPKGAYKSTQISKYKGTYKSSTIKHCHIGSNNTLYISCNVSTN